MQSDSKLKYFFKDQRVLLALVIIAIVIVVSIINPRFIMVQNIITIFQQICVLGILTMAMSMLLISGGIDLSVGNIMTICGVVMAYLVSAGVATPLVILAGLGVGMLCGFLNGVIISKSHCIPLIISLGTSQVFYGLALTISGGRIMMFRGSLDALRIRFFGIFPTMLILLAVMVFISFVLMNKTKFGRRIVAIGGNEKNAFLSGINVDMYKIAIYTISGHCCDHRWCYIRWWKGYDKRSIPRLSAHGCHLERYEHSQHLILHSDCYHGMHNRCRGSAQ